MATYMQEMEPPEVGSGHGRMSLSAPGLGEFFSPYVTQALFSCKLPSVLALPQERGWARIQSSKCCAAILCPILDFCPLMKVGLTQKVFSRFGQEDKQSDGGLVLTLSV